jgi:hypothetical protein
MYRVQQPGILSFIDYNSHQNSHLKELRGRGNSDLEIETVEDATIC